MSEKNLFLVEVSNFVPHRKTGFLSLSFSSHVPIYVIAKDYNEAFHKVSFKIETIMDERKRNEAKRSILDEDGSLIQNAYSIEEEGEPKIVGIKLIEDIVVW
jgi:hypothetical protein